MGKVAMMMGVLAMVLATTAAGAADEKPAGGPSCKLLTQEAPAGGRLEVQAEGAGRSPLVKIGGKVARLLQRQGDTIAVQIDKRSQGGAVTLVAEGKTVDCGTLTIIGTD